jgi:CheY-like chemotaxis protein
MARPEDKTVLVVDDEEDVREYLAMALEDAGFQVVRAADGNEALARIAERIPDFISLDLVMPGKSGIKLLHELRRNRDWKGIPFVIVTAHARDDLGKGDLEEIMSQKTFTGPNVYLEKPVKPEQYVAFVCQQLGIVCEEEREAEEEDVRTQLQQLIESADPDRLAEALRVLKKSKRP